jgi:hypothetical protein
MNVINNLHPISPVGGGLPAGGTEHAGHAQWATLITPFANLKDFNQPPQPSEYANPMKRKIVMAPSVTWKSAGPNKKQLILVKLPNGLFGLKPESEPMDGVGDSGTEIPPGPIRPAAPPTLLSPTTVGSSSSEGEEQQPGVMAEDKGALAAATELAINLRPQSEAVEVTPSTSEQFIQKGRELRKRMGEEASNAAEAFKKTLEAARSITIPRPNLPSINYPSVVDLVGPVANVGGRVIDVASSSLRTTSNLADAVQNNSTWLVREYGPQIIKELLIGTFDPPLSLARAAANYLSGVYEQASDQLPSREQLIENFHQLAGVSRQIAAAAYEAVPSRAELMAKASESYDIVTRSKRLLTKTGQTRDDDRHDYISPNAYGLNNDWDNSEPAFTTLQKQIEYNTQFDHLTTQTGFNNVGPSSSTGMKKKPARRKTEFEKLQEEISKDLLPKTTKSRRAPFKSYVGQQASSDSSGEEYKPGKGKSKK